MAELEPEGLRASSRVWRLAAGAGLDKGYLRGRLLEAADYEERCAAVWEVDQERIRVLEGLLRDFEFSPDGLPEAWPNPERIADALASAPEEIGEASQDPSPEGQDGWILCDGHRAGHG